MCSKKQFSLLDHHLLQSEITKPHEEKQAEEHKAHKENSLYWVHVKCYAAFDA